MRSQHRKNTVMQYAGATVQRISSFRQNGVTLIELMVTIAVLAILAAIAVPNLRSFILSNALSGATSELRAALARARLEAINRQSVVSVGPLTLSGASVYGWQDGYRLFANPLNAAAFAPGTLGTGTDQKTAAELLQGELYEGSGVSVTSQGLSGNPGMRLVSFQSDGRTASNPAAGVTNNGRISVCVDNSVVTNDNIREIVIDIAGQVRVERKSGPCPTVS
jgi:type IV fimbrial biogenesis protein FimT